jgi:RHS repeat-associated protein
VVRSRDIHGSALDQPLEIIRGGFHSDVQDQIALIPHQNWRGLYDNGTFLQGGPTMKWPASSTEIKRYDLDADDDPGNWFGSLIRDGRDGGGTLYRRNRYYDAATGRFTQEDPIGLAGGLNLYGFAGGDPVNHADPFGLSPTDIIVQGENSRKVVDYLYENSATFRAAYDRLNNDHRVQLTIRDSQDPFEVNSFVPGGAKSGTIIFNDVNLNQANYNLLQADPKANWMFTGASVLGHEMGHANAWLGNGSAACKTDSPPGCILRFENKIRMDLPASARGGIRPRYDFTPGKP